MSKIVVNFRSVGSVSRNSQGLTISEILISIALLTLMLITTLLLFTQLLASTTKNGHLETASILADRVLEEATLNPRSSTPAYLGITDGEDSFMVEGEENPTKFVYRLEATQVGDTSSGGERWFLEVEVKWWNAVDSAQSGRAGYGELRTKQSRLVYVKW